MIAEPDQHVVMLMALERLYLFLDPQFGENQWRARSEFDRLPPEQRTPNHVYRFSSARGVIVFDESRNGQYFATMPDGIDPATLVDVPAADDVKPLASGIAELLERIAAAAPPGVHTSEIAANVLTLADPAQPRRALAAFAQEIAPALAGGDEPLRVKLDAIADRYADMNLEMEGTGRDAAAVRLLATMAHSIDSAGQILAQALGHDFSSLEETAVHFARDAIMRGFEDKAFAAAERLRQDGDTAVESARQGFFPAGHPKMALPMFYTGLFLAGLRVQAARLAYNVLSANPALDEKKRRRFKTNENVAEEKLMRIVSGLTYAIRDITGDQFRALRSEVQDLIARGDVEDAKRRVTDAVNNFLYPLPFRRLLGIEPDAPP